MSVAGPRVVTTAVPVPVVGVLVVAERRNGVWMRFGAAIPLADACPLEDRHGAALGHTIPIKTAQCLARLGYGHVL